MEIKLKSFVYGILAGVLFFIFYLGLLTLFNSFHHALLQFTKFWYLRLLLIIGFGIHIGLFIYTKNNCKINSAKKLTFGTSTGVSVGTMFSCCSSNFLGVFYLLGITNFVIFLAKYQLYFLGIGIILNIISIIYIWNLYKKR